MFSLRNELDGRFEPIASVVLKRLQFASKFGLPVDQDMLLGDVFRLAHLLGEAQIEKEVDLLLAGCQGGLGGCNGNLFGLSRGFTIFFELSDHCIGYSGLKGHFADDLVNLVSYGLLPDVFLRAGRNPLGAAEVVMTLLGLGGDDTATLPATKQSAVEEGLEFGCLGLALALHDRLHLVKKAFRDDRLVLALVEFAI